MDRSVVVETANEMIAFLSTSGTQVDQVKREAIVAVTTSILHNSGEYKGFSYLNQGEQLTKPLNERVWDNTRIRFI